MTTPEEVPSVIEPLSQEILHTEVNWFIVEFAPTSEKKKYELKFVGKGTGGLTELRENLVADDKIFYGSLQVNLIDENGSKYDKYVYFKYLPNKANKAKRFLWGWENPIKTSFKFKHVMMEYLDENLTGFDEEGIAKEFLRVSENQMEYKSIDFGGNNIYTITNGNIKKGRPADMDANYSQAQPAQVVADQKVDIPDDPVEEAPPAAGNDDAQQQYEAPPQDATEDATEDATYDAPADAGADADAGGYAEPAEQAGDDGGYE